MLPAHTALSQRVAPMKSRSERNLRATLFATCLPLLFSVQSIEALAAPTLTLRSVEFPYTAPIYPDADDVPYSKPQWTDGGVSNPIVVFTNSIVYAQLIFTVSGADQDYEIEWKGESGTRPFISLTNWVGAGLTNSGLWTTRTISPTPGYVGFANPWTVDWTYRVAGSGSPFISAGLSSNPAYLTFTNPVPGVVLYRSVAHHACATTGATTADQAVANSWSRFVGTAVKTWNNETLYYYQPGISWADDHDYLEELLFYKNGTCVAWKSFLISVFGANGISSTSVGVTPSTSGAGAFLINNWTRNNAGTGSDPSYKWRIVMHTNIHNGSMVPNYNSGNYGDLTSTSTVYGQGTSPNAPAEKIFGAHYIVKRTADSGGATYYDPSYGITYTGSSKASGEAAFDASSVYGFSNGWSITNTNWRETYVKTNNPSVTEVSFTQ